MKIEILFFNGCPNFVPARDRLRAILRQEGLPLDILEIEVKNHVTAQSLRFLGSPTIRINGLDIERACRDVTEPRFACRRYAGGIPSEGMIRSALKEAQE